MSRKITYRPITKELEDMVKPDVSENRYSIGSEKDIGEYFFLNVDKIKKFKNQARKLFNNDELLSLSDSIKEHGVRQPITVISSGNGEYEVVSGERRLIAAKMAGLSKIPCIILKNQIDSDAIALIENIHRKDLHIIELGSTYKNLLEKGLFSSQVELARKISVPKSHISESIKYASIPDEIQRMILEKNISSREYLRKIAKYCSLYNVEKVKEIISNPIKNKNIKANIITILKKDNQIVFDSNISSNVDGEFLTEQEKSEIKLYLEEIIKNI